MSRIAAKLVLEDGSVFEGTAIGASGATFGEIVFHTGATGYQEILTDPSYRGQMVLMTHPEIGNYGVNAEDVESLAVHASGFIVRRLSTQFSSWRGSQTLDDYLKANQIIGIQGVDTRQITRKIRELGALKAGITTEAIDDAVFLRRVQAHLELGRHDLVSQVTTRNSYTLAGDEAAAPFLLKRLVVVDFGIKQNILRNFQQLVEEIIVLPAHSPFELIASFSPEAVFLSNGPGDPRTLTGAIAMAGQLIDSGTPTFGICLGHQILALASGATVSKMRFGHHGANHPVKDLQTGEIAITSQNHGYAVTDYPETLAITHVNLYDQSIEGFRHTQAPVMSIQFHPEASPGPHDAQYLFGTFIRQVREHHQVSACA